jgi:D-amino-acid dehydrogenase
VQVRHGHHVTALRTTGAGAARHIDHVEVTNADGRYERIQGDAYVLAMGSFSPLLAQPLGLRLPIYPAKGYSVTLPVLDAGKAYQVSLTDDEFKLVFSRYTGAQGDRLRIAGTAEFNGYDRNLDPVRCEAIVRRVQQLFPGAGDTERAQFWSGLRPATPSNVPLIGRSPIGNLFLNTGHGTLGWTHACGSGMALAELVSGRRPAVDFDFLGLGIRNIEHVGGQAQTHAT